MTTMLSAAVHEGVIFTSASTTFQYLLTGRIIMSLALFYGVARFGAHPSPQGRLANSVLSVLCAITCWWTPKVCNLAASYCGTSLVLFLQERFPGRRSIVSGIAPGSDYPVQHLMLAALVPHKHRGDICGSA